MLNVLVLGCPHVLKLWEKGQDKCDGSNQEADLTRLLAQFNDVFSQDGDTLDKTVLVEHHILELEGVTAGRQPPPTD